MDDGSPAGASGGRCGDAGAPRVPPSEGQSMHARLGLPEARIPAPAGPRGELLNFCPPVFSSAERRIMYPSRGLVGGPKWICGVRCTDLRLDPPGRGSPAAPHGVQPGRAVRMTQPLQTGAFPVTGCLIKAAPLLRQDPSHRRPGEAGGEGRRRPQAGRAQRRPRVAPHPPASQGPGWV